MRDLFEFQFMVNAFRAGTVVAVLAGTIGWFMVLRRQTFAGHTLALIGFPGAAGAVLIGLSPQLGFFAFCIGGALVIGAVPQREGRFNDESAVIAIVQAFALACGFLFASLYRGSLNRINSLLFGTFLGVTNAQVVTLTGVAIAALVALGGHGALAAVRFRRSGSRGGRRRAHPCPVHRLSRPARRRGRGSQPDHRLAADLRVAGPATGDSAVDHGTTGVGTRLEHGHRGCSHVDRTRDRVLLPLPHRFLDHVDRVRLLRRGARRTSAAAHAPWSHLVSVADLLGISDMLSQSFMRNAFLAGSAIALAAGLTGYFVVLRGQVFTGDALSHVAFTGALAALAAGVDVRLGLFAAVLAVALLLGLLGDRGRADDVAIGAVFAWTLGLGVLFLSVFTANHSSTNSAAGVNVLFGSIFGFDASRAWWSAGASLAVIVVLLVILRPLLYASIDPIVAAAAGVPVRALGFGFLLLVGVVAGVAAQAVGALLLLALLAAPAAAAQHLTVRPTIALGLSAAIAVGSMWIGLTVSYRVDDVPPSFAITATLTAAYVLAAVWAKSHSAAHASVERGIMPGHDRAADAGRVVSGPD